MVERVIAPHPPERPLLDLPDPFAGQAGVGDDIRRASVPSDAEVADDDLPLALAEPVQRG